MRPSRLRSVCLVAISVSCGYLVFVSGDSVWTQEPKQANPRVKELQNERLAALESAREVAKKLFQTARIEYGEALSTQRELLEARIAYAEKKEDRIKACDEAVQEARHILEITQSQKDRARGTDLAVLKAQAFVFEIRIIRETLVGE